KKESYFPFRQNPQLLGKLPRDWVVVPPKWARQASSESPAERREAAETLGKLPRLALPLLVELLNDRDAGVRLAAARSVRAIVAEPGLVLVPDSGRGGGPAWTGEAYKKLLGGHGDELRKPLPKLATPDPAGRAPTHPTL